MFAQESVMDFQKEKEAFESVFTEAKGWDLTFIMGCYQNIETLRAFAGWLAAKAQAVPEGFVLVNKKDLVKVLNCVTDDWLVDTDSFEEFKKIESLVQDEVNAMIEAQEPAND